MLHSCPCSRALPRRCQAVGEGEVAVPGISEIWRDPTPQRCLMKRMKMFCPAAALSLQVSGPWRGWGSPCLLLEEHLHGGPSSWGGCAKESHSSKGEQLGVELLSFPLPLLSTLPIAVGQPCCQQRLLTRSPWGRAPKCLEQI